MSEVACENCQAACCRGPRALDLRTDEAETLQAAGTDLIEVHPALPFDWEDAPVPIYIKDGEPVYIPNHEGKLLRADFGRYFLLGACAHLETSPEGWQRCRLFGQPERPEICSEFETGCGGCKQMRVMAGVDEPSKNYPDLTAMLLRLIDEAA